MFGTVAAYQAEYRGLVEYYRMAHNLRALDTVRWVMETSLLKTLAAKLRLSVNQAAARFHATLQTENGPRKGLRVVVTRECRKPLVAKWGGISLRRRVDAVLDDHPPRNWNVGTELLQRFLADSCELCRSRDGVQVHHIRALRQLQPQRPGPKPEWVKVMAARHQDPGRLPHLPRGHPQRTSGAARRPGLIDSRPLSHTPSGRTTAAKRDLGTMRTTMFRFFYEAQSHGGVATVTDGEHERTLLIAYFDDPLSSLAHAAVALTRGRNSPRPNGWKNRALAAGCSSVTVTGSPSASCASTVCSANSPMTRA
jgi:hypothetical protein